MPARTNNQNTETSGSEPKMVKDLIRMSGRCEDVEWTFEQINDDYAIVTSKYHGNLEFKTVWKKMRKDERT